MIRLSFPCGPVLAHNGAVTALAGMMRPSRQEGKAQK
jgi:hypothetical protein